MPKAKIHVLCEDKKIPPGYVVLKRSLLHSYIIRNVNLYLSDFLYNLYWIWYMFVVVSHYLHQIDNHFNKKKHIRISRSRSHPRSLARTLSLSLSPTPTCLSCWCKPNSWSFYSTWKPAILPGNDGCLYTHYHDMSQQIYTLPPRWKDVETKANKEIINIIYIYMLFRTVWIAFYCVWNIHEIGSISICLGD